MAGGVVLLWIVRRPAAQVAVQMLQRMAGAVAAVLPAAASPPWQELADKLEAFGEFQRVAFARAATGSFAESFAERVRAACPPGAGALWAVEGVAYSEIQSVSRNGAWPRGLLASPATAALPERAVVPAHTGMGLALAVRWLSSASATDPRELAALCADNARAGLAAMAFEGLGFAARTLYPDRLPRLDEGLSGMGSEARALFWHGVGRGSYWSLLRALPAGGSARRAVAEALSTAPHELGRRNALAGLAWALTLVNLRHPEVVASFVRRGVVEPEGWLAWESSFAHGAASAIRVWRLANGRDDVLEAFLRHRPLPPGSVAARLWDRLELASRSGALEHPAAAGAAGSAELFSCPAVPAAEPSRSPEERSVRLSL